MRFYVTQWSATRFYGSLSVYRLSLQPWVSSSTAGASRDPRLETKLRVCTAAPSPEKKSPLGIPVKKKNEKKGPLSFVNIGDYRIKKHADNNTITKTGKPAKVYKNYYYKRRAYVPTFLILYCLDFSNCLRRAKSLANKFHDFLKFNFSHNFNIHVRLFS